MALGEHPSKGDGHFVGSSVVTQEENASTGPPGLTDVQMLP